MTAARAFARTKPIVAYKAGRFPESAQGRRLAHRRAGLRGRGLRRGLRARRHRPRLRDRRHLRLRRAGRPPQAAGRAAPRHRHQRRRPRRDGHRRADGAPAACSPSSRPRPWRPLDETLPPAWSHGNPVDVLGRRPLQALRQGGRDRARRPRRRRGARDPHAAGDDQPHRHRARSWPSSPAAARKPILAAWLGGGSMREGAAGPRPRPASPPTARRRRRCKAFMTLVAYAPQPRDPLRDAARHAGELHRSTAQELRARFAALVPAERRHALRGAVQGAARGLRHPGRPGRRRPHAPTRRRGRRGELGYPVVLKMRSPDITHKTDVGGVALDLGDDGGGARGLRAHRRPRRGGAARGAHRRASRCSRWCARGDGVELILGAQAGPGLRRR